MSTMIKALEKAGVINKQKASIALKDMKRKQYQKDLEARAIAKKERTNNEIKSKKDPQRVEFERRETNSKTT